MCATRTKSDLPQYFYIPANATTRNYYVCLTPPKALHHVVGKQKYRQSTGTADLRKAKALGARLIAEKRAEWDLLLSKTTPEIPPSIILSRRMMEDICARRLYHWLHIDDLGRYDGAGYDDKFLARLQNIWDYSDQTMRSVIARGKLSAGWEEALEVLDFWCNQIKVPVSRTDPLYPQLVRRFAHVELEGSKAVRARSSGVPVQTPTMPITAGSRMSGMADILEAYLKTSRKGKSVTTPKGHWEKFTSFLGDLPLEDVAAGDVFKFLEHGLNAPSLRWSNEYTHGPVRKSLQIAFSLAISKGLRHGANPVDALTVLPRVSDKENHQRLNPRHAYTDADLSKVFASEWFNHRSTQWKGKMAKDLGIRYWGPLISLFHGNRVREVVQLVASDFRVADGLDLLCIQEAIDGEQAEILAAGASRSVKNEATKRTVPLHPKLIELGILAFVQGRRDADGQNAMLFPSSIPRLGGKTPILGRAYEQAFLRFVATVVGRGFGNHGFRHQLEDRIRDAQTPGNQWPPGLGQRYAGRKNTRAKDAGRVAAEGSEGGYGDGYTPKLMLQYVATLDFSHIQLPSPFEKWLQHDT